MSFISDMVPNFDFSNLPFNDIVGRLESQSLTNIKRRIIGGLKKVFENIEVWSDIFKKIFYLFSLAFICYDAHRYDKMPVKNKGAKQCLFFSLVIC